MANFSIIIPAYNEEENIEQTINDLKSYIQTKNLDCEIIVVNDGSDDQTKSIIEKIEGIKPVSHPYNKGYGASIKTGVAAATTDWILTFDSDGQHRVEYIEKLWQAKEGFDMVVGARQSYKGPLIRQPGKKIIHWVAEYLVERKIPDLNSGLRLIKKQYFLKYSRLLPNAFSWTTTITLAFFKDGFNVNYIPIEINKRQGGKSLVGPKDAVRMFMLILRIIILFSPLKIFLPASASLFALGIISAIIDIMLLNISDTTVLLFISGILIFFFGLLADQIAAIRRELK